MARMPPGSCPLPGLGIVNIWNLGTPFGYAHCPPAPIHACVGVDGTVGRADATH